MPLTRLQLSIVRSTFVLVVAALAAACGGDPETSAQEHLTRGDQYLVAKKYNEAIIEFRAALQRDPVLADAHYKLGEAYAATSDVQNALGAYVRAADLAPENTDAQLKALNLLLLARQFEDAKSRAREVVRREPKNSAALLALGNALAGLRNFDDAVAANQRAIEIDPNKTGLYLNLGTLQFISGNPKEAEEAFKKAVALEPENPDTLVGLAAFYWAAERVREAETEFSKALALDNNHVAANRQLAGLYFATQRPDLAERHLRRVVDITKDLNSRLALSDFYFQLGRATDAIALLDDVAAEPQNFAPAKIRTALLHYVTGQRNEARRALDQVLARDSKNAGALAVKAHVLLGEQRIPDALKAAQSAVEADQRSPQAQFALGKVLLALGRRTEAKAAFDAVTQLEPAGPAARIELADLSLMTGDVDSAYQHAQQAMQGAPRDLDTRLMFVRVMMNRPQDAKRVENELSELGRRFPKNASVQRLLGDAAAEKGDMAAARKAYERATELSGAEWHSLDKLVTMDLDKKQVRQAVARVETALKQQPDSAPALLLAGKVYAAAGDVAKAESHLRRVIDLELTDVTAYAALAGVYLAARRLPEARTEFERIAERRPRSVAPLTMIGIISEAMGDQPSAIAAYEKALGIDARAATAANNLAWIYASRGENLDRAMTLAQTAHSELPQLPEVSHTLGWVYFTKGQVTQAMPLLEEAVERDKTNPLYHFHFGMALAKNGENAKASASLKKALSLQPDFGGAAEARRMLQTLLY
jgi:putative PEP-CTERM system TPR-repeat lipoprotein